MAAAEPAISPLRLRWLSLLTGIDHAGVMKRVCDDAEISGHFLFMTIMSAGIAILGLLLSSPAVVIGAMLISPLMGPIIGFGFGLALFSLADIRRAAWSVIVGMMLAILFSALVVLVSPVQTITSEIAARTRPNLFDLGVAVLSGLAGTYAMIRGRHGAIVGVAIAVAVMPPLAVIGFGLATANWPVLAGSAFLFFTNLMAIGISAAALARFYGFGRQLSPSQTWLQGTIIVAIFAALGTPLTLALGQIGRESVAARQAQTVLANEFNGEARIAQVDLDFGTRPVRLTATIFSPAYRPQAEARAAEILSGMIGEPVEVQLEQVRVGGSGEADAAQLAAARGAPTDAANPIVARLALVAGVDPSQVLVDRQRRIARVRAAPLPGATMQAYRELENRARSGERAWTVLLVPPPLPLPELPEPAEPLAEANLPTWDTILWAARRLELSISLSGGDAGEVAAFLARAGVAARIDDPSGPFAMRWLAPGEAPAS